MHQAGEKVTSRTLTPPRGSVGRDQSEVYLPHIYPLAQ